MKKIYTIFVCICLLAGFVACEKDKDFVLTTLTVQNETITPSYGSATIDCSFKADATISEAFVQYSLSSSFAKYDVAKMTEDKDKYAALLLDLQDNTTYYIRYAVSNKYSSIVSEEVIEFQTLQCTVPTIVLDSIVDVWDNRAKAYLHLAFDGGASVTDMGICWSKQANPTIVDIHKSIKDTVAVLDMTDLQENMQYYVRAYAVNKVGTVYSEEHVLTTFALPEVRTEEVTDIRLNSAQLTATLLFDGNDSTTVKGFCWSTTQEPTMSDNHIIVESESANYTCLIADLLAETQYYVRAFAQNKIGVAYGEEKSFKTQKTLPILTTSDVTEITETSVTIRGYVISDGGSEIIERGVVYSTSQSPTIGDNKVTAGSGKGEFYCKLEDLQKGVVYYVRAYAENEIGIAYGAERSFMTDIPLTPADGIENGYGYVDLGLSVKWATMNVGATKPEECGNYYAWGEVEVKDTYSWYFYKYCEGTYNSLTKYNTSIYSEIKDDKITLETMDDVASVNWGGLWRMPTEKEVAELREKCTCSWTGINGVLGYKITSKSNGKSIFLPAAGFRDNSSLISDPAYGYYWSSSLNTDLSYNARALWFSSNSIGGTDCERCDGLSIRSVCDEITIQAVKPTIMTTTVTQITETSAVAGGNVTSDGGASVTERGVVYSTNPNPVITNLNNTIRPCGSGTGAFTYNMTGLQSGTTYYVRAYATNEVGTAYGEEVSFTTNEEMVDNPPSNLVAMPFSVSAGKQVTFSKGNLQYTQSTNTWSFAENQWNMIGTDNVTGGSVFSYPTWGDSKEGTALADKLDVFCWSTSATNYGVSTSNDYNDYSGSFVDWGTNKIDNDAPNTWRTLTSNEWEYLLENRPNASSLKGVAQVNGVNGLILLPDTWTCPEGVIFKSGFHSEYSVKAYGQYQTFTAEQWSKLESAGAVFLPASGNRYGSDVNSVQLIGYYRSAPEDNSYNANELYFSSDEANMYRYNSDYGFSVRLVKDL